MSNKPFQNLDIACARMGQSIAENTTKELESLITHALSVLEEQGVYALFLYLKSHKKHKTNASHISDRLAQFLTVTPASKPLLHPGMNNKDILIGLQKLGENLDDLLFARELLHQSLVYARYHSKIRDEKKEGDK